MIILILPVESVTLSYPTKGLRQTKIYNKIQVNRSARKDGNQKMINIAICDDEEKELNKTNSMCEAYTKDHPEQNISIATFRSPVEFLDFMNQKDTFDILFLDIYMPGMTGTELAHALREKQIDCQIVFLTTSLTHAVEAFSLHAVHYLVKPFTMLQFEAALEKAISFVKKNENKHILLKTSNGVHKISLDQILYAETSGHKQTIYQLDGTYIEVRMTSSELFELLTLDDRFFKCGSTYIVNLAKIKELNARFLLFDNEKQLPMLRRHYKDLLCKYTEYSLK